MSQELAFWEVKNTRDCEETPASMEQIFAALGSHHSHHGLVPKLLTHTSQSFYSFEIVVVNSRIHFILAAPQSSLNMLESQLTAHYPKITFSSVADYAPHFLQHHYVIDQLRLSAPFYYPLKTYKDLRDLDPLAGVLGQLAKIKTNECLAIQIRLEPAGNAWQRTASAIVARGIVDQANPTRTKNHPQAKLIESKISQIGFRAVIRLLAVAPSELSAKELLNNLTSAYGVYALGEGNNLELSEPFFWQKNKLVLAYLQRNAALMPRHQILNSSELASLWHPPGESLAKIKNISWANTLIGEAPENLPVAGEKTEQPEINFFARTEYKNKPTTFGLKKQDRRKHLYIIGKTGAGKSTLIANLAINDMRNNEGVAVIDPHGDLSEILLDYIPAHRINDVAYLDPSDLQFPFHLNPLELTLDSHKELIASGIVSIFYKLYHYSWGPRLEYILRNTLLTLLAVPNSTLLLVPEILTNDKYRQKIVEKLSDRVLQNFWLHEFNKMSQQLRSEAVSPILNKVGQFISSTTIRNIIGHPASTINLEKMMNDGKIMIINLSQGKLGEDNSSLLGAMIITKLQLAAMNRVYLSEEKRRDFYLYVDEFQNFATNSFIKILSEARKYHLNLTLANQYIGQIDEGVQKAIFGNAGSLISFAVGATDAAILAREFGDKYKTEELVNLGNYQIVLKLSIDNQTSSPFSATTLPLPRSRNQNREKVTRSSRERYTKKVN